MSLPDVIHARQARIEAQLKLLELASARDQSAAQLYFRYVINPAAIQQLKQSFTGTQQGHNDSQQGHNNNPQNGATQMSRRESGEIK
jgi:hypothetical protein